MRITNVRLFRLSGRWTKGFPPGDRQVKALDIYPEFNEGVSIGGSPSGEQDLEAIYLSIETDKGVTGLYGPINAAQAQVIERSLRPFLLGRDPLATETLLDQMTRLDRHGRTGLFMTGISAIDCALWDLKGKAWCQPVYRLLGGPTRPRVPAYASMLGFSVEPESAAEIAVQYRDRGFCGQKWFFRYGPADGEMGMEKNLAMARAVRQAVGPHYTLMFDAFMGWTVPYAIEMAQGLAQLTPAWLEEPVPPERMGALRKVRQVGNVPVATGEHVYTRWQVKELLVQDAVDVVQTDPDWTGGITELVKICALASAFEVPVVAHGHSLLAALHVAAAQSPTVVPMVEYLIQHQERQQFFHNPVVRPDGGSVALPDLPGLGLVLNEEKIESCQEGYA